MSSIVESTYNKVRIYLQSIFGDHYEARVAEVDESFIVTRGSARVNVMIKPWHEEECRVVAQAYVVHGAKITPALMRWLLKENSRTPFGAFSVSFDDTIIYSHSITGANLDANELRTTVNHVAFMADEYDDMIREMAGGTRAVDAGEAILAAPPAELAPRPRNKPVVKKRKPESKPVKRTQKTAKKKTSVAKRPTKAATPKRKPTRSATKKKSATKKR